MLRNSVRASAEVCGTVSGSIWVWSMKVATSVPPSPAPRTGARNPAHSRGSRSIMLGEKVNLYYTQADLLGHRFSLRIPELGCPWTCDTPAASQRRSLLHHFMPGNSAHHSG